MGKEVAKKHGNQKRKFLVSTLLLEKLLKKTETNFSNKFFRSANEEYTNIQKFREWLPAWNVVQLKIEKIAEAAALTE